MICTASTVSDTRWKIIAAAMAEKAKPTVLERLAATKITIDTATHNGVSCARSARPYRNQPKCQPPAPQSYWPSGKEWQGRSCGQVPMWPKRT